MAEKKINIIYARGSGAQHFVSVADKAMKIALDKGWIRKITHMNGNLVRLEDIDKPIDIYHCHSAHSLHGIKRAKEMGAVTILQRDSSHVLDMVEWCEVGNKLWKDKYPQAYDDLRSRTDLDFQLKEYEEADYILLASKLEVESFAKRGIPRSKLKRIPFTVDVNKFKPSNKEHEFGVCLGGNERVRKGYPEAKEACNKLNIPLGAISGVPYGSDQIVDKLNNFDVCLAPTREDGYPCQVLESMSCGLVPILSNRNGVKDLIKDGVNGFIVDITRDHKKFIDRLAEILTYLRDNPKICKEIGLRARETVSKRTWKDYGTDVAKFYEELVKKRG